MKLDDDGGIAVYVAAEKPEGVPDENWLPVNRGNYDIDVILRLYVPGLEKFKTWQPPKAEKLASTKGATTDQAKKAAKEALDTAKETAKKAYEKVKEAAKEAYEKVKEAVGSSETTK